MFGLHGLGHLEAAAAGSFVEKEDRLPSARGREGLSREVTQEGDPYKDSTVREWVETLERDDPEDRDR